MMDAAEYRHDEAAHEARFPDSPQVCARCEEPISGRPPYRVEQREYCSWECCSENLWDLLEENPNKELSVERQKSMARRASA